MAVASLVSADSLRDSFVRLVVEHNLNLEARAVAWRLLESPPDPFIPAGAFQQEKDARRAERSRLDGECQKSAAAVLSAGKTLRDVLAAARLADAVAAVREVEYLAEASEYRLVAAWNSFRSRIETAVPTGVVPVRPPKQTESRAERKAAWLGKAIMLKLEHPDWHDSTVAEKCGIHPSQLSRCPEYKEAVKLAAKKGIPLKGHDVVNADGLHDVEAVAPPTDKPDRGDPIPNSRLFIEYCDRCDERIRVCHSEVGNKPLCETCKT